MLFFVHCLPVPANIIYRSRYGLGYGPGFWWVYVQADSQGNRRVVVEALRRLLAPKQDLKADPPIKGYRQRGKNEAISVTELQTPGAWISYSNKEFDFTAHRLNPVRDTLAGQLRRQAERFMERCGFGCAHSNRIALSVCSRCHYLSPLPLHTATKNPTITATVQYLSINSTGFSTVQPSMAGASATYIAIRCSGHAAATSAITSSWAFMTS